MAAPAEAQKPTYSAVPDSAIPAWAASLQQMPSAAPALPGAPSAEPVPVADTTPIPDAAMPAADTPDDVRTVADPSPPSPSAPVTVGRASPPPQVQATPPAPSDDYQARRAAWRSQLDSAMQGQAGAGTGDNG